MSDWFELLFPGLCFASGGLVVMGLIWMLTNG
jgi:hypothetical protein